MTKFCNSHVTLQGKYTPMGWERGDDICLNCGFRSIRHLRFSSECVYIRKEPNVNIFKLIMTFEHLFFSEHRIIHEIL